MASASGGQQRFDRELDARGLSCPLPIFNTKKSVESLGHGEVIKVVATDRGAVSFFESLVRQTDLQLISWHQDAGEYVFYLLKP